jgi:hypothetical protein
MTSESNVVSLPRPVSWKTNLLVLLGFLGVSVCLQFLAGAYHGEFGSEPDEAAHYVSGLFVHDFVKSGALRHAREFADSYYNHYPKVAIGHWGPTFSVLQAGWALLFTPQRASIMVLMALLTAVCALMLFRLLQKEFPTPVAFVGAWIFMGIPIVQRFSAAVMTEIPITLLVLLATIFFARYMENERKWDSFGFAVCASMVILIKFSGILLAFVPPLAILLTRQYHLLKKMSFWLAAIVVVILAGPWSILTVKLATNGISDDAFGWAFTHKAVPYYLGKVVASAGAVLTILAVIGLVVKWPRKETPKKSAVLWGSMIALLFSVLAAAMMIPAGYEARHLIPALPALVLFAVAGADWFRRQLLLKNRTPQIAATVAFGIPLVLFLALTFRIPHKGWSGFQPVAQWINTNARSNEKALVSSDARGEGMFISEVAMADTKRPNHFAERSSKKFADSSWSGSGYKLFFSRNMSEKKDQKREYTNAEELFALLKEDTVTFFVLDQALENPLPHHLMLREIIEKHPEQFVLEKTFPLERSTKEFPNGKTYREGVAVYRFKHS